MIIFTDGPLWMISTVRSYNVSESTDLKMLVVLKREKTGSMHNTEWMNERPLFEHYLGRDSLRCMVIATLTKGVPGALWWYTFAFIIWTELLNIVHVTWLMHLVKRENLELYDGIHMCVLHPITWCDSPKQPNEVLRQQRHKSDGKTQYCDLHPLVTLKSTSTYGLLMHHRDDRPSSLSNGIVNRKWPIHTTTSSFSTAISPRYFLQCANALSPTRNFSVSKRHVMPLLHSSSSTGSVPNPAASSRTARRTSITYSFLRS